MRNVGLVAILLALLFVLAGCPTTKPTGTSDTGTTPAVTDTTKATAEPETAEEPQTPVATEAHPTAKVVVLKVGDQFDAEKDTITSQTKTLNPDTPVIYVSAGIKGLTKGEMVKGTLMAVDVTDTEGTQIRDYEVTSKELEAPGEESTMDFKFSAPTTGWPVGSYRVDLEGNGKLIETIELTVEGASS